MPYVINRFHRGFFYKKKHSLDVGAIIMGMYPLNFEEFVDAYRVLSKINVKKYLRESKNIYQCALRNLCIL